MNVARYLSARYGPQPCWELVVDIYRNERAELTIPYVRELRSVRAMADAFRIALHNVDHGFVKVVDPTDYDIVLLGRNDHIGIHHCGVWFEGKILHAEPSMTLYEERSALACRYKLMEFWTHAD